MTDAHNKSGIIRIEREVMKALLHGEHPVLSRLRRQYARTEVAKIDLSSNGVRVFYFVPREGAMLMPGQLYLGDVFLQLRGMPAYADALLSIERGRLDNLELSMLRGHWPDEPVLERILYTTWRKRGLVEKRVASRARDLNELRACLDPGRRA